MKQLLTFFSFARDTQLLISPSILSIFHSVIFLLFLFKNMELEKFATQPNVPSFQLLIFYFLAKDA